MGKYYYENSITTILSDEGREVIDQELGKIKPVCEICGTELVRISMMEGDCIICPVDMYKHTISYDIIIDRKEVDPPHLKKRNIEETAIENSRKKLNNV